VICSSLGGEAACAVLMPNIYTCLPHGRQSQGGKARTIRGAERARPAPQAAVVAPALTSVPGSTMRAVTSSAAASRRKLPAGSSSWA
jgi:hypothetical protein